MITLSRYLLLALSNICHLLLLAVHWPTKTFYLSFDLLIKKLFYSSFYFSFLFYFKWVCVCVCSFSISVQSKDEDEEEGSSRQQNLGSFLPISSQGSGSLSTTKSDQLIQLGCCQIKLPKCLQCLKFPEILDPQSKYVWIICLNSWIFNMWQFHYNSKCH